MCEVCAIYFLFARGAIGGPSKRAVLEPVVAPLSGADPPHWQDVADTMDEGIGNPGSGYNIRRDLQIGYLLDFALRLKALPGERRAATLGNPWELRDCGAMLRLPGANPGDEHRELSLPDNLYVIGTSHGPSLPRDWRALAG